jgi:Glycosyltransferase family 10 (fucosyltransferase) C-term
MYLTKITRAYIACKKLQKNDEEAAAPPVLVAGMHGRDLKKPEPSLDVNTTTLTAVAAARKKGELPLEWLPKDTFELHVQRYFPGQAIFFNGESRGDARGHNSFQLGYVPPPPRDDENDDDSSLNNKTIQNNRPRRSLRGVYFMTLAFMEIMSTRQQRDAFFIHANKPKNTGKYHGVIYVTTNCVNYRQQAADRLSDVDPENIKVYYGGQCRGKRWQTRRGAQTRNNSTRSKLLPVPTADHEVNFQAASWLNNSQLLRHFRYCLVMENTVSSGYITEKIVNAFLGGCVPIYYGTTEVFDIFNKQVFIFYNVENPEPALEQIRYMEKKNRSVYDEMLLHQPILANGSHYRALLFLAG